MSIVTDPAPGVQDPALDPANPPADQTALEAKWDADTKAYIEKLRRESASHRTVNKDLKSKVTGLETDLTGMKQNLKTALGIKDDSANPEEKLKSVVSENEQIKFRAAVLETAVEHGVSKDGLDYFSFLVSQKAAALKDGEELSQEQLVEIAKSVKQVHGKGGATTTVLPPKEGNGGGNPPPPGSKDGVTLAEYNAMGITARSKLYVDNPELYEKLRAQAKSGK